MVGRASIEWLVSIFLFLFYLHPYCITFLLISPVRIALMAGLLTGPWRQKGSGHKCGLFLHNFAFCDSRLVIVLVGPGCRYIRRVRIFPFSFPWVSSFAHCPAIWALLSLSFGFSLQFLFHSSDFSAPVT